MKKVLCLVFCLLSGLANAQSIPFPGPGMPASSAAPTTIFTTVGLILDDTGFGGGSVRNTITISAGSAGRVRVTFKAGSTTGLIAAHAAIGIYASGGSVTTATPVELLFSGASGFSIGAGASITSDYVALSFTGSDKLVAILDITSGNIANNHGTDTNVNLMFKIPAASYNQSSDATFTGPTSSWNYGVSKIETAP